jgi:hypothetical protein
MREAISGFDFSARLYLMREAIRADEGGHRLLGALVPDEGGHQS